MSFSLDHFQLVNLEQYNLKALPIVERRNRIMKIAEELYYSSCNVPVKVFQLIGECLGPESVSKTMFLISGEKMTPIWITCGNSSDVSVKPLRQWENESLNVNLPTSDEEYTCSFVTVMNKKIRADMDKLYDSGLPEKVIIQLREMFWDLVYRGKFEFVEIVFNGQTESVHWLKE